MIVPSDDILKRPKSDVVLWYKEIAGMDQDDAEFMAGVALGEIELGEDID